MKRRYKAAVDNLLLSDILSKSQEEMLNKLLDKHECWNVSVSQVFPSVETNKQFTFEYSSLAGLSLIGGHYLSMGGALHWLCENLQKLPRRTSEVSSKSEEAKRQNRDERFDLVPFEEIAKAYVRVAEFGAMKYSAWNWTSGTGLPRAQIIRSLLSHVFAYMRGEDIDKDSGLSHTDHILWNAVALTHSHHWQINDDRRKEPSRDYKSTDYPRPEEGRV